MRFFLAGEGAIELLFELFLQFNDADEGVFGAGIADFATNFVVKLRYNSPNCILFSF